MQASAGSQDEIMSLTCLYTPRVPARERTLMFLALGRRVHACLFSGGGETDWRPLP